jgi:general stress protein 26
VNVSHASPTTSVSLAGLAILSADPACPARYWHDGLDDWFPNGPTNAPMIEVTVFEGRSWTVAKTAAKRL